MLSNPLNTIFIGQVLHQYDDLDSTNALAFEMASKSNPIEGTAITTHYQSEGKGQIGSTWHSEPFMNLLTSIILTPRFLSLKDQFYLNIISSLAVCDVLEHYFINDLAIKWPNDVYVGNQKIGGILVQSILEKASMKYAILGIGLNVNQTLWPAELPNPIAMKMVDGNDIPLEEVRQLLYQKLEYRYLSLKRAKYKELLEEYLELLYKKDVFSNFDQDGKQFMGTIRGIDEEGRLVIEMPNGTFKNFRFRSIRFLP